MKSRYPYYLANHPKFADQGLDVVDKNTGEVSTRVSMADTTTIDQAIAGAVLLCGGHQAGTSIEATLLEEVPDNHELNCQEAFGPVAILSSFSDFDGDELIRMSDLDNGHWRS